MAQTRIYQWDIAKAALMLLVVIGHFTEPFTAEGYPHMFRAVFLLIYTFHMPAFIFISGLFSKTTIQKTQFPFFKLLPFLVLCFLLKGFYLFTDYLKTRDISVLNISRFPNIVWFLFALFVFYALMFLLKGVNPKAVMVGSVLLACVAGYDESINDVLALSRIIVFFPFFAAGYYLQEERVRNLLHRKAVRIAAVLVLLSAAVLFVWQTDALYTLRPLITGRNPFSKLNALAPYGGMLRLAYYAVSTALAAAFFAVMPNWNHRLLLLAGKNTLSVYFWHLPLVEGFFLLCTAQQIWDTCGRWLTPLVLLIAAVALWLLLSQNVFAYPLLWIKRRLAHYEREE